MNIAISSGHNVYNNGVFDTGSVGNGVKEANLTKETVKLLKPMLEASGHRVTDVTPYNERFIGSKEAHKERAKRVNAGQFDLYIDIHINSGGGTGPETIVSSPSSKAYPVARDITKGIARELGLTDRRGVKAKPSYWSISQVKCPAIIVEACFIDTREDINVYSNYRYALGVAKALGYKEVPQVKEHWSYKHYKSLKEKGVDIHEERFEDLITRGEVFALLDRIIK